MVELFSTQLIKVGNSYGLLVPNAIVKRYGLKPKEKLKVALLKEDKKALLEAWGMAQGTQPFIRDKKSREF